LLGSNSSAPSSKVIENSTNEVDLSWLDNIWGKQYDVHRRILGNR
jgi:hypothetical protein